MKPDLLLTQIKHIDYPIWRYFLKKHRDFFGKIIVFFNENNRFPYLDHFMHNAMADVGDVQFLDQKEIDWGTQDWRNVSTNEMLKHTSSDWVCSIEQDFFAKDWNSLFTKTQEAMETSDLVGWWQENNAYIHPSYWFIKRSVLDRTSQDFSARTPHDHFGWISEDVKAMGGKITTTQQMGFADFIDCFHMGGVNDNYLNFGDKMKSNSLHREELFYIYNYWSMRVNVPQSPVFMDMMVRVGEALKAKLPHIDPETDERKIFFM